MIITKKCHIQHHVKPAQLLLSSKEVRSLLQIKKEVCHKWLLEGEIQTMAWLHTYVSAVWFSSYFGAPDFITSVVDTPTVTSRRLALHSFKTCIFVAFRWENNGEVCRPCTSLHLVLDAQASFVFKIKRWYVICPYVRHVRFLIIIINPIPTW